VSTPPPALLLGFSAERGRRRNVAEKPRLRPANGSAKCHRPGARTTLQIWVVFIEGSAGGRGEALDHVLLGRPAPASARTTLAQIVAARTRRSISAPTSGSG